jgi:hypothetical protein
MLGDLLVIVPSRGRPQNLARLLDAVHKTGKIASHVHAGVDENDPELERYRDVMNRHGHDGDILETGPRKGLAAWTNEIAMRRARQYPFLASFGDDMVPRTPGWDKALVNGIKRMGGTGLTYPWDSVREDIPEAVVLSSNIVTALGWMALPSCSHFYIDNAWADLGRGAGCIRHLRAVAVDHVKQSDETAKGNVRSLAADEAAYQAWKRERMADDIRIIAGLRGR